VKYQGPAELVQNGERTFYGEVHLQAKSDGTEWLGYLAPDRNELVEMDATDTWSLRLLDGVAYEVQVTSVKVECDEVLVSFNGVGAPPSALS
jgi:hypothetical protein